MKPGARTMGACLLALVVLGFVCLLSLRPPQVSAEDRLAKAVEAQFEQLQGQVTVLEMTSDKTPSSTGGQFVISAPRNIYFEDPTLTGDYILEGAYDFPNPSKWTLSRRLSYWKMKLSGGNYELFTSDRVFVMFPTVIDSVKATRAKWDAEEPANLAAELRQNLVMIGPHQRNSKTVVDARLLLARLEVKDQNWQQAAKTLTAVREGVVMHPQFSELFEDLRGELQKHFPENDSMIPPPLQSP